MGYHISNAAYAHDMRSEALQAPLAPERPKLGVVHGAGRQASQDVSPQFTHCVKMFAALVAIFVALGLFRVTVAGLTAASLNNAATLSNNLVSAQEQSSDLEVMRSVYGSSTRIRDLAEGYGMVEAQGGVTLDFTEYVDSAARQ